MDATDTAALLAPLRPWLNVLMHKTASCRLQNPARVEHGVVFTFHCDLPSADDPNRIRLRAAIDIVYRVFALHTSLALYFEDKTNAQTAPLMVGTRDASVRRQLVRDAPFQIIVCVGIHGTIGALELMRIVTDELCLASTDAHPKDTAFHETRARLDALLAAKNPKLADELVQNPIQVKCSVRMSSRFGTTETQANGFFEQLFEFSQALTSYQASRYGPQSHLPVGLELESVRVPHVPVTPAIARTVSRMIDTPRVRPKYAYVVVDPRYVACSREDLGLYLLGVGATFVELGAVGYGFEEIEPMDTDADLSEFIRDMLTAVVNCESVATLRMGGLFSLFDDHHNRSEISRVLVDTVMSRAKAITLMLDDGEVGGGDARSFSSAARLWKADNPQNRLRLKRLLFTLYDYDSSFMKAVVDGLDEVEELFVTNSNFEAPRISAEQVVSILQKFTMLRELSLGHVDVDSMHVFSVLAPSTLESLTLTDLRLNDRQSFLKFIEDLGYPDRPFTQQLRGLRISEGTPPEDSFGVRLTALEQEYLMQALRANRVLESVKLVLERREDCEFVSQSAALMSAAGSVVPAPARVRHDSEEKSRRVAFLSVLHAAQVGSLIRQLPVLDTFLVRRIFSFSDPWVPRHICTRQPNEHS